MTPAPSTAALRMRMRCGSLRSTAWRIAWASRRPISMVLSVMSCLHCCAGDHARLALVVHGDVRELCFGDLHRGVAPLASALRVHLHVHGDGSAADLEDACVEAHEVAHEDRFLEDE